MPLRRSSHAIDQRERLVRREQLTFVVMGDRRQILVNKFDAATIEKRSIARYGHQHRPTAVIGYADDAAGLQCERVASRTACSSLIAAPSRPNAAISSSLSFSRSDAISRAWV